ADGVGRYNHFQQGSIYWSPQTGAWSVHGLIHAYWASQGYERGPLGYPLNDETDAPGPAGARYNDFSNGSVYWSAGTGAHAVKGPIRTAWLGTDGTAGPLGLPTADAATLSNGTVRQTFFGGRADLNPRTGGVTITLQQGVLR